jgi:hypothetical protein
MHEYYHSVLFYQNITAVTYDEVLVPTA